MLSQVRRRVQMIFVVAALAAVATATGCSASSGGGVDNTPSPAALTVSNADSKAIISAFDKYNEAYVVAYNTANADYAPFLAAGGGNGAGLQASLQKAFSSGFASTGGPPLWQRPHVEYVDSNSSIAAVTSCFNPKDWKTTKAGKIPTDLPSGGAENPPHPIYAGDGAGAYTVLTLLNRTPTGAWTVVQTSAQPDQPC
ncbi:MAG TPA: hypothetical protein VH442_19365 [Micromonosporaceae bacterium]